MTNDRFTRELRLAIRSLLREPAFTAGVVATFALAVGANAAMFGIVSRLMLAPPPGIRDAAGVHRIQIARVEASGDSYAMSTMSYPTFAALSTLGDAFAAVAAYTPDTAIVGRGADAARASVIGASGAYFTALGATPTLGRLLDPADDAMPQGNPVAMLGHAYWRRAFGGDAGVLGREIVVDGRPVTIVGVAEPRFNGDRTAGVDLYLPLSVAMRDRGDGWWRREGMNIVSIVARLRAGVSVAHATDAATKVLRQRQMITFDDALVAAQLDPIVPGPTARQSTQSRVALWLAGVAVVVLLIAAANVATLLLLRAARKRRDVAVRIALGARPIDLARQVLIECVVLAVAGGAAGLVLSRWIGGALRVTLLPSLAPSESLVDARVLMATMAASLLAGALSALAPLARTRRLDTSVDLRGAGQASSRFGSQNALVAVQVALCALLLVGAGLFVRSLERVRTQNLGYTIDRLLYVTLELQGASVSGAVEKAAHVDALARVRGVPGVRRASFVQAMPFGNFHVPPISVPGIEGMPTVGGQPPYLYGATPDYLAMMGVTLRAGRLFTQADERAEPLVVIVNESMAAALWPGRSALGQCVRAGHPPGGFMEGEGNPADGLPCRTVVGVVRDSRARSVRTSGNETKFMQYYVPFAQLPKPPFGDDAGISGLLVEIAGDAERVGASVQRAIQSTSEMPVYARVIRYQDLIDPQLRAWRLGAVVFTAFGVLALGIAAVGILGVVSYVVTQRTREIGIRLALGAERGTMRRMVVLDSLRTVTIGLAVGLAAALSLAPRLQELLFETSARDPANLAATVVVTIGVAVVAALFPAWRAGRVDPLIALRADG